MLKGEQKIVKANTEIILAAGTVGTTKLLLLSGVGPRKHLESLKVFGCRFSVDDVCTLE